LALTTFPERGIVRDDLLPGLRIIGFERRASIAFIVEAETVRILRIFYSGRDFPREWTDK
jgi:toxin ParE1/3/4